MHFYRAGTSAAVQSDTEQVLGLLRQTWTSSSSVVVFVATTTLVIFRATVIFPFLFLTLICLFIGADRGWATNGHSKVSCIIPLPFAVGTPVFQPTLGQLLCRPVLDKVLQVGEPLACLWWDITGNISEYIGVSEIGEYLPLWRSLRWYRLADDPIEYDNQDLTYLKWIGPHAVKWWAWV